MEGRSNGKESIKLQVTYFVNNQKKLELSCK